MNLRAIPGWPPEVFILQDDFKLNRMFVLHIRVRRIEIKNVDVSSQALAFKTLQKSTVKIRGEGPRADNSCRKETQAINVLETNLPLSDILRNVMAPHARL